MIKYIAYFKNDSWIEFEAIDDEAAMEYAEWRAEIQNTEVDFIL